MEGQEKHGLCRVSACLHPRPAHFPSSSWALGGHRIYHDLPDSLGFSREWFWDDSGAWKMDRQRVEGQEWLAQGFGYPPPSVHFPGSSWALGGHRLYLRDSLRSPREWSGFCHENVRGT